MVVIVCHKCHMSGYHLLACSHWLHCWLFAPHLSIFAKCHKREEWDEGWWQRVLTISWRYAALSPSTDHLTRLSVTQYPSQSPPSPPSKLSFSPARGGGQMGQGRGGSRGRSKFWATTLIRNWQLTILRIPLHGSCQNTQKLIFSDCFQTALMTALLRICDCVWYNQQQPNVWSPDSCAVNSNAGVITSSNTFPFLSFRNASRQCKLSSQLKELSSWHWRKISYKQFFLGKI